MIARWLDGLEERLRSIVRQSNDPQMVARLGIYEGIAREIREGKWKTARP